MEPSSVLEALDAELQQHARKEKSRAFNKAQPARLDKFSAAEELALVTGHASHGQNWGWLSKGIPTRSPRDIKVICAALQVGPIGSVIHCPLGAS